MKHDKKKKNLEIQVQKMTSIHKENPNPQKSVMVLVCLPNDSHFFFKTKIVIVENIKTWNYRKLKKAGKIKNCIEKKLDSRANVNLSLRQILPPT
jgi:hypothetical protein